MTGSFQAWMARVDAYVQQLAGVMASDLADWAWYDTWASGTSAHKAAQMALSDEF